MAEEQGEQRRSQASDSLAGDRQRRSLWRRIAGDGSHLGFWTLPVFVATALGGAVIAGALAQVYYAQQVAQLEEETAAARNAAEAATQDIEDARQEALAEISSELEGVRSAIETARPLPDPAAAGVVALAIELTPEPEPSPSPEPSPDQEPPPEGGDTQPGSDDQTDGAPLPSTEGEDETAEEPSGPSGPPEPVPGATVRNAVGFVVSVEGDTAFVATSHGAVADPFGADGVSPAVTVTAAAGSARGIVHAWDEARGVAVVRVTLADVEILPWRPAAAALEQGDVAVLAAVTPGLVGVQLPGRIGAATDTALVTDLPVDPVFDGAPLVDAVGRVIGLQSSTATPFGRGSTGAITARELCVELISGCELLEEADPSDQASEDGGDGG